jgi:hypothetical protein
MLDQVAHWKKEGITCTALLPLEKMGEEELKGYYIKYIIQRTLFVVYRSVNNFFSYNRDCRRPLSIDFL